MPNLATHHFKKQESFQLDPDIWGPHFWFVLHTMAMTYPHHPNAVTKKKYYEFIDERCFPKENAFEQFRIKKYNNDGNDAFDAHVDVIDYASSRRFLSFFWYLNDVNEGGETVFSDLTIKPETGKLVIFPPLWMFPHQGNAPISYENYLLSTYLHYK